MGEDETVALVTAVVTEQKTGTSCATVLLSQQITINDDRTACSEM